MQCVTVATFLTIYVVVMIAKVNSLIKFRVTGGEDDTEGEFPFVVSLQYKEPKIFKGYAVYRACTGTLIAHDWVLTAAHCMNPDIKLVRYGNMSIPRNESQSFKEIVKMIPHPSYRLTNIHGMDDIGLIMIQKIQMAVGKLSAIDSKTIQGMKARYAGFGFSTTNISAYDTAPLQLGEGLVVNCPTMSNYRAHGPHLCIVPTCSRKDEGWAAGDSGGPIFFDGKIIAVISARDQIGIFTPVSPYLDWIRDTMIANTYVRRVRDDK
ncbi:hypothetical protein ABMA28_011764 [Loxostege sticticalis]|uniref:Peptidase S1 domain-containing protein n=1 Tax=Loxostege sticticalis TaxID=481309 RepID=A0ABD0TKE7_LOXSC